MEGHKKNEFNLDNGKKGKRKKVPMKNYCEKKNKVPKIYSNLSVIVNVNVNGINSMIKR